MHACTWCFLQAISFLRLADQLASVEVPLMIGIVLWVDLVGHLTAGSSPGQRQFLASSGAPG